MIQSRDYYIQEFNSSIFTVKHKTSVEHDCFNCLNPDIRYDAEHDMLWCVSCGMVIKQALEDFTPPDDKNYTLLTDL